MLTMFIRPYALIKIISVCGSLLVFFSCGHNKQSRTDITSSYPRTSDDISPPEQVQPSITEIPTSYKPEITVRRIAVGAVTNNSGKNLPVDATKMLEDALKRNLESKNILWADADSGAKKLVATSKILNYKEPDDFTKWLLGTKDVSLTVEIKVYEDNEVIKLSEMKQEFSYKASDPEKNWSQAINTIADSIVTDISSTTKTQNERF